MSIAPSAVSTVEAAGALGVCRSTIHSLIRDGALESFKVGRRRLVPVAAIDEFAARSARDSHRDHVAALVERTTASSGVPLKVEDVAAVERVAALLRGVAS